MRTQGENENGKNMERVIKNYRRSSVPKIDVHVHYVPQAYQEALLINAKKNRDRFLTLEWDIKTHLYIAEQCICSQKLSEKRE